MPNHLYGILVIASQSRDAINRVSTDKSGITKSHNPMLSENSLSKIMRWYKARSTFEVNKMRSKLRFFWQSRFYDHVIRNEESLLKIREYIHNNPLKWDIDENNPAIFLRKG